MPRAIFNNTRTHARESIYLTARINIILLDYVPLNQLEGPYFESLTAHWLASSLISQGISLSRLSLSFADRGLVTVSAKFLVVSTLNALAYCFSGSSHDSLI